MGKRAKACDWRVGQMAKRRAGFVFSGEADMPLRPIALSPSRPFAVTKRRPYHTLSHQYASRLDSLTLSAMGAMWKAERTTKSRLHRANRRLYRRKRRCANRAGQNRNQDLRSRFAEIVGREWRGSPFRSASS
jgi:hypothetical protein